MPKLLRALLLVSCLTALPAGGQALELAAGSGKAVPDLRFSDLQGNETDLKAFEGKPIVLNLWATWCAPCREEMPSLDRLQAMFPKDKLVVLALSVDRAGPDRVQQFLDEIGVKNVNVYRDPKAQAARELRVPGLPSTILIDKDGNEAGRLMGIAKWDSPEAVAAVEKLVEGQQG